MLDALLPPPRGLSEDITETEPESGTRQKFRKKLRERELDDKEIEIELNTPNIGVEIMAPPGMEEMTQQLQGMFQNLGTGRTRKRQIRIKDALKLLTEEEGAKLINEDDTKGARIGGCRAERHRLHR